MPGLGRRQDLAVVAFLTLLAAAVFGQTLSCGFMILDDPIYVVQNPHIARGLTLDTIRWALTTTYAANWHPLTWISHMLDIQVFGLAPAGHHATSLLLHIVNTAALYAVLHAMTGARGASAVTAALFAVHPLRVESVAWVAERKDVLSAFFWLMTMASYLLYTRRPRPARYAAMALSFTFGLAAKPVLVTLPFALLLLDWWPLGRLRLSGRGSSPVQLRPLVFEKLPLIAAALVVSVVTYLAQGAGGAIDPFPLGARLANAAVSYAGYLGKTVWPAGLAIFYPHPLGPSPAGITAESAALLLVVTLGSFFARRRQPWIAVGWFWYLGALLPMVGLVQVGGQAMADRYTYLPLIGIFLAVSWTAAAFLRCRPAARWPGAGAAVVLIATLAVASWFQARLWRDEVLLFRQATAAAPGNWVAHTLLADRLADRGKTAEAEEQFRLALRANPYYFGTHAGYAIFLYRQGRLVEAREQAEQGLRVDTASGAAVHLPALLANIASRLGTASEPHGPAGANTAPASTAPPP